MKPIAPAASAAPRAATCAERTRPAASRVRLAAAVALAIGCRSQSPATRPAAVLVDHARARLAASDASPDGPAHGWRATSAAGSQPRQQTTGRWMPGAAAGSSPGSQSRKPSKTCARKTAPTGIRHTWPQARPAYLRPGARVLACMRAWQTGDGPPERERRPGETAGTANEKLPGCFYWSQFCSNC